MYPIVKVLPNARNNVEVLTDKINELTGWVNLVMRDKQAQQETNDSMEAVVKPMKERAYKSLLERGIIKEPRKWSIALCPSGAISEIKEDWVPPTQMLPPCSNQDFPTWVHVEERLETK